MALSLPLDRYFALAHRLADHAAQRCREMASQGFHAELKRDKTWVTEADLAIEQELRAMIAQETPEARVLGEEEGGEPLSGGEELVWILDPIDGTFSFVHGIPFYSSLLALYQGTIPLLGVACLPGLGIKMSALRGKGCWIGDVPYVRPRLLGQESIEIVATADPHRFRMEGREAVLNKLYSPSFKCRTYPDALGYYLLLTGAVRAFVDPKVEVWDVAPFHIILPEAGFAIHPWDAPGRGPQQGTSLAYPLNEEGKPWRVDDVLSCVQSTD